jgi:hypothetical protein
VFEIVGRDERALATARDALRLAERRVGVQHRDQVVELTPAAPAPLTELLPDGDLPAGAAMTVQGSAYLMCWLLGAAQGGRWIALVGWPALSPLAMSEAGVDLERVFVVPDVGGRAAAVLAALVDGFEIVVAGPRLTHMLTPSEQRRLVARARQHDSTLLSPRPWEGSAMTFDVEHTRWGGLDDGDGWIREAQLTVVRHSNADGPGTRFDVVRTGTSAPTAVATHAVAGRLTG